MLEPRNDLFFDHVDASNPAVHIYRTIKDRDLCSSGNFISMPHQDSKVSVFNWSSKSWKEKASINLEPGDLCGTENFLFVVMSYPAFEAVGNDGDKSDVVSIVRWCSHPIKSLYATLTEAIKAFDSLKIKGERE